LSNTIPAMSSIKASIMRKTNLIFNSTATNKQDREREKETFLYYSSF